MFCQRVVADVGADSGGGGGGGGIVVVAVVEKGVVVVSDGGVAGDGVRGVMMVRVVMLVTSRFATWVIHLYKAQTQRGGDGRDDGRCDWAVG